jgi:EmrB/QacA subfamily drug resistance transporter
MANARLSSWAGRLNGLPRPHHRLRGLSYEWQALIVVIVGSFMVMLDATVMNIALPRIITVFNAKVETAQFVTTGYMIALAIIMPATGYLSDTFGTKRIYLISMFLFTGGSLLCGLSWSVESLVFFRVLQGLGGGMLSPLGMTIIFKIVPPERRGLMAGVFGLPLLFAPVVGPTLGGYIVEYINWRFIFTLNLPIGLVGMLLGWALLRETERIADLHLDLPGFILSGVGFSAVFYGLSQAPDWGWGDVRTIILMGGGGVILLVWIVVELTSPQPMLELRVFKNGIYALATSVNFIVTLGMFSSMLLLPLFLQNFRGLGAMETGLLMFPQALASGLMLPISGRLFDRIGPRPLIISGLLLLAYATWQLNGLNLTTPDATIRSILILRGLAMGLIMMPAMTVAMNTLPGPLVARGSSLTNVLRQLFGAFGTAIFVTLLQTRQTYHQAMLSQTVTPDLLGPRVMLAVAQQYLMQHGLTLAQAKAAGVLLLYEQVAMTAAVHSFEDCFIVAAVICLFGIVPALFLRSSGVARRPAGAVSLE